MYYNRPKYDRVRCPQSVFSLGHSTMLPFFTDVKFHLFILLFVILFTTTESKADNDQKTILVDIKTALALSESDFINADFLSDVSHTLVRSISEVNNHRGDIREKKQSSKRRWKRNGIFGSAQLWPNGRIPYAISSRYNVFERALIAKAIKKYHMSTCIQFVPKTTADRNFLFIGKIDGCFSDVGRSGGMQILSLDNGCLEYPTIIHDALVQFGRMPLTETSYYGQPYDYRSILHYDSLAFSKNGRPTMLPKKNRARAINSIGHAVEFSRIDLAKINRMYSCLRSKNQSPTLTVTNGKSITVKSHDNVCADTTAFCWMMKSRCSHSVVVSMMRKLCAKSCKLCIS